MISDLSGGPGVGYVNRGASLSDEVGVQMVEAVAPVRRHHDLVEARYVSCLLGAVHLRAEISGQARISVFRPKFQAKILAWRRKFWTGQTFPLADE